MAETIYLIDGSAFVYRAFHAVAALSNKDGLPTNAVFGFVSILRKWLKERQPGYGAVCFDSRGPVFRHHLYQEYKANRPPMPADLAVQMPYIRKIPPLMGLPSFEEQEVEADDIIASAATRLSGAGHEVVIVSGDKDLLQLVNDRVVMWDPMNDRVMDSAAVREKYQVGPEALLDCYALIGDRSDNIPGVPGIGPKSAARLICEFGDLDRLYDQLDSLKPSKMKERIIEHRDSAFLSRDLIRLKTDVPVPADPASYRIGSLVQDELRHLYGALGFHSLLKELEQTRTIPVQSFQTVTRTAELEEIVALLEAAPAVAIDTETTSVDARKAELVGISLSIDGRRSWYIPVGHRQHDGSRVEEQLPLSQVKAALTPFLVSETIAKIGHHLKYDYTVLKNTMGVEPGGPLIDTMIAAYLAEPFRRSFKLDDICLDQGLKLTSYATVTGGDKRPDAFAYVSIDEATRYSCEDVYGTLMIWEYLEKLLDETGQRRLFQDVEMLLVPVLAGMENDGIRVDASLLDTLAAEFGERLAELEERIHRLAGHPFNINSPQQLGTVLFAELGLPHGRKTKTGYSTDMKVLEKLAAAHELPALVISYRNLAKLLSTYVDKLKKLIDRTSGRVHTSFNQAVTATGRLSSSNPNLQNIPIRGAEGSRIREAFVPEPGKIFLSADYSQIDLRVLAHYSQDPALVSAFRSGADIHSRTAAEIFAVSPLLITPEMRRVAKSINFGIVYGMSSFGLSSQLQISRKEAQRFIDRYFELYGGVKQFMGDIVEAARKDGYVTTLLNRRRYLPELKTGSRMRQQFAERAAINTPIQGTAADIIKLAMLRVHDFLKQRNASCRLLLQIHDELVFELSEEECAVLQEPIRREMEQALELDVPLVVNMETGSSLAK